MQSARRMIVAFAAIAVQILSANAAEAPSVFHVATRTVPPLVQKENGRLTGFSIDLWNALANRLGGDHRIYRNARRQQSARRSS